MTWLIQNHNDAQSSSSIEAKEIKLEMSTTTKYSLDSILEYLCYLVTSTSRSSVGIDINKYLLNAIRNSIILADHLALVGGLLDLLSLHPFHSGKEVQKPSSRRTGLSLHLFLFILYLQSQRWRFIHSDLRVGA